MSTARPFSARADKRDKRHATGRYSRIAWGTAMFAIALLPAVPAHGMDAPTAKLRVRPSAATLPLPAIPYLETMDWLTWQPPRGILKIDTLQPPWILKAPSGNEMSSHPAAAPPTS